MVRMRSPLIGVAVSLFLVVGLGWGKQLTVIWPDIEQGACTVIVGPDGTGVLIDAGTRSSSKPDEPVVPWLRSFKEANPPLRLLYIITTHYHEDHISWIDDVIADGLLEHDAVVYDRGGSYCTNSYTSYETSIAAAQLHRRMITVGDTIDLGDGATLRCVVAPDTPVDNCNSDMENSLSLGLLLSYRDFQAWVGGDLSSTVEKKVAHLIGDVDLYVMHHHGSGTSSSSEFLDVLKPEVTICQVGDGNPYRHPTPDAVARVLATVDTDGNNRDGTPIVILQNRGAYGLTTPGVYVADPDGPGGLPGTITLTSDGTSYTIRAAGLADSMTFSTDGTVSVRPMYAAPAALETRPEEAFTYRLSLVSNQMPVYHRSEYWILIVYPQDIAMATVLATNTTWSQAVIFEQKFKPGDEVTLWIAAIDHEKNPDVGQIKYTLTIPALEPGDSLTFTVKFSVLGDSGGPATMEFRLDRI